jgi:hypothetical protein
MPRISQALLESMFVPANISMEHQYTNCPGMGSYGEGLMFAQQPGIHSDLGVVARPFGPLAEGVTVIATQPTRSKVTCILMMGVVLVRPIVDAHQAQMVADLLGVSGNQQARLIRTAI